MIVDVQANMEMTHIRHKAAQVEYDLLFMSHLSQKIGPLADLSQITRAVTRAVGEYLDGHRCFFFEHDETDNVIVVGQDWSRGETPSLTATSCPQDFGTPELLQKVAAGRTVVEDVKKHPLTRNSADSYEQLCVRALAMVPFHRDGHWVASLALTDKCPRVWSENELSLLEAVISYTWPLVERACIEQALRKSELSHARLYQQSLQREEQLRQSERALKEAIRLKDDFLATISHELRSPLNSILGYVRLLRSNHPDEQTLARHLDIIERNAQMQAQLIEDLLDTSRIVGGQLRLEQHPVNLAEVVEKAIDVVRPAAESKGVALHATLNYEAGRINGDPNRLQQVVWNLLSNAVKFTPEGGRVNVELWVEDVNACMAVCDTGEGIGAEFLPYVFDRFRQADASSSRRHGGLGLGLSLVRHLIELHGGTVEALSDGPGQGSTFIIRLPTRALQSERSPDHFLAEEAWARDPMISPNAPSLADIRVLVVDDQEDVCELLSVVLAKYGAEVITASSGEEALELLADHSMERSPDVFICDIGMPGEDGYAVLRRLRACEDERGVPPAKRIPAIALTSYVQASDRIRALAAGFRMHVSKPVDYDELATVIASLTGRLKNNL